MTISITITSVFYVIARKHVRYVIAQVHNSRVPMYLCTYVPMCSILYQSTLNPRTACKVDI